MAEVTITASATVTLDGRVVSASGSFTAEVDAITEQTIEIDTAFAQITAQVTGGFCSFYFIENNGSDDAVVQFRVGTAGNYHRFALPAGGHILLPTGADDGGGATPEGWVGIAARAVSTTTRLLIIAGRHA